MEIKLTLSKKHTPTLEFTIDELLSGQAQAIIDYEYPHHEVIKLEVIKD